VHHGDNSGLLNLLQVLVVACPKSGARSADSVSVMSRYSCHHVADVLGDAALERSRNRRGENLPAGAAWNLRHFDSPMTCLARDCTHQQEETNDPIERKHGTAASLPDQGQR